MQVADFYKVNYIVKSLLIDYFADFSTFIITSLLLS